MSFLDFIGKMSTEVISGEDSYWCIDCRNGIHNHLLQLTTGSSGFGVDIVLTCNNKSHNGQGRCRCYKGVKKYASPRHIQ